MPMAAGNAATLEDGVILLDSEWVVLSGQEPTRSETLKENEALKLFDVVPRHQFRLEQDANDARGRTRIAADTVLLAVQNRDDVWCEAKRKSGNERFVCLADTDGDGQPDHYFRFRQNSELFINAARVNVKLRPLGNAIGLASVDWLTEGERFVIELFFQNRAEWVKKNFFSICINRGDLRTIWGTQMDARICLGQDIVLDDDEYPYSVGLYGGFFRLESREKNFVDVNIISPPIDISF